MNVTANVMVTTVCNRRCPSCCCKDVVHSGAGDHFAPEAIAREVGFLHAASIVYLTGGEPTLHPHLDDVIRLSRLARGNRSLILVTNGHHLTRWTEATRMLSAVHMSMLDEASDPLLKAYLRVKPRHIRMDSIPTTHYHSIGGEQPCRRHGTTVSVMSGRVYPCCVACGIDGAESAELDTNWISTVDDLKPPCSRCVFGQN